MAARRKSSKTPAAPPQAYSHPEATSPVRPEIGTQAHFKKSKAPARYRYDSSLAPELVWDEGNPAREDAEKLIAELADHGLKLAELALQAPCKERDAEIQRLEKAIREAKRALATMSGPFLNWSGKAERPSFEVPTLPLFIHERLSTKAILETLSGHKREVKHNEDGDFTREPEMVQAYRDTWELGLHSYLTYLRDRLRVARDLLHDSGSVFVQISDDNLHHVRELMDEVFGAENVCPMIIFQKTTGAGSPSGKTDLPPVTCDFLLWYAKDISRIKLNSVFTDKVRGEAGATQYDWIELEGIRRPSTMEERAEPPDGAKFFSHDNLTSQTGGPTTQYSFEFNGRKFAPRKGGWKTNLEGMERLKEAKRLHIIGDSLRYVRFLSDFPCSVVTNSWSDTVISGFGDPKVYVVQTNMKVVERCLLMTTEPGDLVIDPTCGSGTTAYVAEQWGRRWITCDTSRVPLALARQRLLTATFDYHELKDEARGPVGGFVYKRKQNKKGEEVGGIVPHITLKSIATNEPHTEEVLVDRPEVVKGVTRVTGPFVFEATIPTAEGLDEDPVTPGIQSEDYQDHVSRMTEVLRRAPVLRLPGNQTVTLKQIRPPAKTLGLSAEAMVEGSVGVSPAERRLARESKGGQTSIGESTQSHDRAYDSEPVAILFGPETGPISERFVREAWDEAGLKRYSRLFVIGFGIDPKAREFIDNAGKIGIPAFYLQATMDLQMGDLLKNMRSSHVFSVCGLPDVKATKAKPGPDKAERWEVELLGLETFDPVTMEADSVSGKEVPAWFLDTDYNGMVFKVRQAFFPRTGAWEKLKKSLKVEFEEGVWDHLAGTTSAPFEPGEQRRIAVKVIDPRGNELLAVKKLEVTK